jgi:hypothetical protein
MSAGTSSALLVHKVTRGYVVVGACPKIQIFCQTAFPGPQARREVEEEPETTRVSDVR